MASMPFDSMPPPRGVHPNEPFFSGHQGVRFGGDEYHHDVRRPGPAWVDEDSPQARNSGRRANSPVETEYRGFIFEKAPATKGKKSSWARVRPHALPFEQAKLAEICRKAQEKPGTGLSVSWMALSATQKAVVNHLMEQQQALEKNRNAAWVVENVHRVMERSISGWGSAPECKRIRVILKRTHKHAGAHGNAYTGMEANDIDITQPPQRGIRGDGRPGIRGPRRDPINDGLEYVDNNNDDERGPRRPPHRMPVDDEFDPRGPLPRHMPIDPAFGMPPQPLPPQGPFPDTPMGPPPVGHPPMPPMYQQPPPGQPGPPGHAGPFPPEMPMQGPPFHGPPFHDQPPMHPGSFNGPPPGQPPMHGAPYNGHPPPGHFQPQPPMDNNRGPPPPNPFDTHFEPGFPSQGGPMHNNPRDPDHFPPQSRPQSRHDLPPDHDGHRMRQLDDMLGRLEDGIDALHLSGGTSSPDSLGYDGSNARRHSAGRRYDAASPSGSPTWSSPSHSSGRYSTPPTSHGSYSPKAFDPPPSAFHHHSPLPRRNSASPRDPWLRSSLRNRDSNSPRGRRRFDDEDEYYLGRSRSTSDGRRRGPSHVRFRDPERRPSSSGERGRSGDYRRDYDSYSRRPHSSRRRGRSSSAVRGIYDDMMDFFMYKPAAADDHPDAGRRHYPRRSALRNGPRDRRGDDVDYDFRHHHNYRRRRDN